MKTRSCDICGFTTCRTPELDFNDIHTFWKTNFWGKRTEEFDICTNCLKMIREKRTKEDENGK